MHQVCKWQKISKLAHALGQRSALNCILKLYSAKQQGSTNQLKENTSHPFEKNPWRKRFWRSLLRYQLKQFVQMCYDIYFWMKVHEVHHCLKENIFKAISFLSTYLYQSDFQHSWQPSPKYRTRLHVLPALWFLCQMSVQMLMKYPVISKLLFLINMYN